MTEIVFLLEEDSAAAMLEGFLPKILPSGFSYRFIPFEGKQDLEKQMVRKIRGYRVPDSSFVILRDQDQTNCRETKQILMEKCVLTGKNSILVRIACRELESWYLADLVAVEKGLGAKNLSLSQNKNPYRNPDDISTPSNLLKK